MIAETIKRVELMKNPEPVKKTEPVKKDEKKYDPDEEFIRLVPSNLKSDIGAFFVLSRSIDPSIKIPNTRSLVSSLQTAMVICGNRTYDGMIETHKMNAVDALMCYSQDNWAAAQEICDSILDDVAFLIYLGYGNVESNSFTIPITRDKK